MLADPSTEDATGELTERRGRRWILGTFVLCPCHLPVTLAALSSLLGGTAAGSLIDGNRGLAVTLVVLGWVLGTAHGFRLVWHASRGTCPVPLRKRLRLLR